MDEPPHHLTKWTEKAFRAIGQRHGWQLADVWFEPYSSRSGLFAMASHSRVYEALESRGWLGHQRIEQAVRALLYPFAAWQLRRHPARREMSGLSMLARYQLKTTASS
jgi:hypothetical protein